MATEKTQFVLLDKLREADIMAESSNEQLQAISVRIDSTIYSSICKAFEIENRDESDVQSESVKNAYLLKAMQQYARQMNTKIQSAALQIAGLVDEGKVKKTHAIQETMHELNERLNTIESFLNNMNAYMLTDAVRKITVDAGDGKNNMVDVIVGLKKWDPNAQDLAQFLHAPHKIKQKLLFFASLAKELAVGSAQENKKPAVPECVKAVDEQKIVAEPNPEQKRTDVPADSNDKAASKNESEMSETDYVMCDPDETKETNESKAPQVADKKAVDEKPNSSKPAENTVDDVDMGTETDAMKDSVCTHIDNITKDIPKFRALVYRGQDLLARMKAQSIAKEAGACGALTRRKVLLKDLMENLHEAVKEGATTMGAKTSKSQLHRLMQQEIKQWINDSHEYEKMGQTSTAPPPILKRRRDDEPEERATKKTTISEVDDGAVIDHQMTPAAEHDTATSTNWSSLWASSQPKSSKKGKGKTAERWHTTKTDAKGQPKAKGKGKDGVSNKAKGKGKQQSNEQGGGSGKGSNWQQDNRGGSGKGSDGQQDNRDKANAGSSNDPPKRNKKRGAAPGTQYTERGITYVKMEHGPWLVLTGPDAGKEWVQTDKK